MPKIPYASKNKSGYVVGQAMIISRQHKYETIQITKLTDNGRPDVPSAKTIERSSNYLTCLLAEKLNNDWQALGLPGHEVYKGDDVFNKAFKVEPWEHIYLTKDKIYFFIWDTRELTRVAKRPSVDVLPYLHVEKSDNHKPIAKNGKWLHLSELEAEPVTFKTDKQMREAATEDDMVIVDADNTSLAPDVSNTSGDLFQDADKYNRIRYVNDDECQVYWYSPAMQALFSEDMSHCLMHGSIQDCIQKFNLRKDMKANESFDKYKRTDGPRQPLDMETNLVRARCTYRTLEERGKDWYQLGLDFEADEKRGWVRFGVKPDKQYCTRLCNVLAELGYDGFKIAALWPSLAIQAGLMTPKQIETLRQGNHVIKDSGEVVLLEDSND